jgi:aarF domain-containing kinase
VKNPPRSAWSRSLGLAKLAARVAGEELLGRVDQVKTRIEQTRLLVEELGRLKGAALKAGQFLTLELREHLPPEANLILQKLQDAVTPVLFAEIDRILRRELSPELRSRVESLSETAIAAASIGQVHSAKLKLNNGEVADAVLKIQYDGIRESIESDLTVLRRISAVMMTLAGKKGDLEPLFREVQSVLVSETDYALEASNLESYREWLAKRPDLAGQVLIPGLYRDFSTSKVLALEHMRGISLEAWIRTRPSLEHRQRIGNLLLELHWAEFAEWGLVQTDPNPGNFMIIEKNGGPVLVLLDFGSMKRFSDEFRRDYFSLLQLTVHGNEDEFVEGFIRMGMLDAKEDSDTRSAFAALIRHSMALFDPDIQPVDFTEPEYMKQSKELALTFIRKVKHSAPPESLLVLHRKIGGLYRLLGMLEVRQDLTPFIERARAY